VFIYHGRFHFDPPFTVGRLPRPVHGSDAGSGGPAEVGTTPSGTDSGEAAPAPQPRAPGTIRVAPASVIDAPHGRPGPLWILIPVGLLMLAAVALLFDADDERTTGH